MDLGMQGACWNHLGRILQKNKNIVIMGADFMDLREKLPEGVSNRYFEMGIAEQNLVGAAAGMNDNGIIPIVYAFSPFLSYRACEFIRTDICMQKKNVKMIGHGAGIDFCFLGPTHHSTEDIGILRALPGMRVLYPGTPLEVEKALDYMIQSDGPVYLRLGRDKDNEIHHPDEMIDVTSPIKVMDGDDVTLISTGPILSDVLTASRELIKDGIHANVLHIISLQPFDRKSIIEAAKSTKRIITIEDHNINGGLGSIVAECLSENAFGIPFIRMGLIDSFASGYGFRSSVRSHNGYGVMNIIETVKKMCNA